MYQIFQKLRDFFTLKLLDWFIIKKYWTTFGFILLIFSLVASVIDLSEKLEDFRKHKVAFGEILTYYLTFIPHINTLLLPMYALISVVFFTSRMAFNAEILSILNAGVSFERLLKPYLFAAGGIAILHLGLNHYIVPSANKTRLAFEHKYVWTQHEKGKSDNVHLFLDPTTKIFIQHYDKKDTIASDFRIEKFDDNHDLREILKSANATARGMSAGHWRLENWQRRTFQGVKETVEVGTLPIDTVLALTPADFIHYVEQNEMTTSAEIWREIQKYRSRGIGSSRSLEIELHRRSADPFTLLILSVIGLSLAGRKVRGGMGLHLAMGIGIGALFVFVSKFSVTFASLPGIPPMLGVWIPNLIFSVVAFFLASRAQR